VFRPQVCNGSNTNILNHKNTLIGTVLPKKIVVKTVAKWFILAAAVLVAVGALSNSILPTNPGDPGTTTDPGTTGYPYPTVPEFHSFAILAIIIFLTIAALVYKRKMYYKIVD
jgi:hypothetical protein